MPGGVEAVEVYQQDGCRQNHKSGDMFDFTHRTRSAMTS